MKPSKINNPILLLLALLLMAALACNAVMDPIDSSSPDQAALIQAAVATVEARTAVNGATQPIAGQNTLLNLNSDLQDALVDLYNRVNPSVVYILTGVSNTFLGSGSGFVFDDQGHIITNNHVIQGGDNFEVVFADGSRQRATIVGTDIDSDLAVIKVDQLPPSAVPVSLADSSQVRVGQFAVAIGNPFGQQGSMSLGIISGLGRSIASERDTGFGGSYSLPQVIQTDAPINPGNSGGPLLNLEGEVIGVNSAIRTTTGTNSGVGFAIPVNAVRRIAPALIADQTYTYPYMGISASGEALTLVEQELYGLPQSVGVYITRVTAEGPAEAAGLIAANPSDGRGGDLIIAVDGQPVRDFNEMISYLVFETEVGQTIDLTIIRDGQTINVPLTLGARP